MAAVGGRSELEGRKAGGLRVGHLRQVVNSPGHTWARRRRVEKQEDEDNLDRKEEEKNLERMEKEEEEL